MTYISQIIVFVLALLGVLFKSTQTGPDGRTLHSASGLPVLTRTGKVVLTLITLSFILSLFTTWQKSKIDAKQKDDAEKRQQLLVNELNEVKQRNEGLKEGIGEILKASVALSDEQKRSFESVLIEQKKTGEGIAENIGSSADLLRSRIEDSSNVLRSRVDNSILLLNKSSNEIGRLIYPLKDVEVSFSVAVPLDHPSVAAYRKRLDQAFKEINNYYSGHSELPLAAIPGNTWRGGTDKEIHSVNITDGSQLLPDKATERVAYFVLNYFIITIDFYKTPIIINQNGDVEGKADLRITIKTFMENKQTHTSGEKGKLEIFVIKSTTNVAYVSCERIPSPSTSWENRTGKIVSIQDLLGAQVVVNISHPALTPREQSQAVHYIGEHSQLGRLYLIMYGGRVLNLASKLRRMTDNSGYSYYIYQFPQTMEELNK